MELNFAGTQTIGIEGNAVYDSVAVKPNCSMDYLEDSGTIILKGQPRGTRTFLVSFGGNVALPDGTTPVAPIELALTVNGSQKKSTDMISTPTAAGAFNNVSVQTSIIVPCGCCLSINVKNFSGVPIELSNANFSAVRTA